jgi:hypothetical protein
METPESLTSRGEYGQGPAGTRYKTYTTAPNSAAKSHSKLLDFVREACHRLAEAGWRELMVQHGIDIVAEDFAEELAKPINVDRSLPGFEDFALEGRRGIEPSKPALSLLFHAFASPGVVSYRADGRDHSLRDFPTPAEI